MKFKLSILFSLIVISGIGYLHYMHIPVTGALKAPKILFALRAKEYCSCFFVENLSDERCRNSVKMGFPILDITVDIDNRTVDAGIIIKRRAIFVNDKLGCKLI